ncbi:MAG: hypothetical protein ACOY0T_02310 [Myxococcota bacterium]
MNPAGARSSLLALEDARIRLPSGLLSPAYSLQSDARRVALIGDFRAVFALLSSQATLVSGSAKLLGLPFQQALANGSAAVAPFEPPVPVQWTCERYLIESARLLGAARSAAKHQARTTLSRFELTALTRRTLGSLTPLEKRLLGIARTSLSKPRLVCCEAPFHAAPDAGAEKIRAALELASEASALLISTHELPSFGHERTLLETCNQVFVQTDARLCATSLSVLDVRSELSVMVSQNAAAFERELQQRNLLALRIGQVEAAYAFVFAHQETDCVRFLVQATNDDVRRLVLEASLAAGAPLLELTMY